MSWKIAPDAENTVEVPPRFPLNYWPERNLGTAQWPLHVLKFNLIIVFPPMISLFAFPIQLFFPQRLARAASIIHPRYCLALSRFE